MIAFFLNKCLASLHLAGMALSSLTVLGQQVVKVNTLSGQDFSVPGHSLYLEGEMVRHVIKYSLWAMASGLSGWSRIWKEHDWEIGYKEIWGRGMWMYTPNGKKNAAICLLCE